MSGGEDAEWINFLLMSVNRWRADCCTEKRPVHQSPGVQRSDLMKPEGGSCVLPGPTNTCGYFYLFLLGPWTPIGLSAMQTRFIFTFLTLIFFFIRCPGTCRRLRETCFLQMWFLTWAQHEAHWNWKERTWRWKRTLGTQQKLLCGFSFTVYSSLGSKMTWPLSINW